MPLRRSETNWPLIIGIVALVFIVGSFVVIALAVAGSELPFEQRVGVINIHGAIQSESEDGAFGSTTGARDIIRLIRDADEDSSVSVILLDVNSGGGSVVASKEIMRAVRNTSKPVVAYIGEVGASGAYYVASAADEVWADQDSLTGSIGAYAQIENYLGLLEKIGVNVTLFKSGKNKAIGSPFEELTPEQRVIFEQLIAEVYNQFKSDVVANRGGRLNTATFDRLADGRVLSGRQALDAGLVDSLGSRDDALARAAQLGGIEGEPREKLFERQAIPIPISQIFGMAGYSFAQGFRAGLQAGQEGVQA
jgi:protease-4